MADQEVVTVVVVVVEERIAQAMKKVVVVGWELQGQNLTKMRKKNPQPHQTPPHPHLRAPAQRGRLRRHRENQQQ